MYNVDFLIFPFRIPPQSNSSGSSTLPQTSIAALGDAAAALQLGLPGHAHHHATPNSMHSYFNSHAATTHQDYLNCLHASAALAVDQHNLEASANLRASLNRTSRKRALSASPGYSELDLANLMARHSPTSLQLLGAAAVVANGGSPSSSGSYGQLSGNFNIIYQNKFVFSKS